MITLLTTSNVFVFLLVLTCMFILFTFKSTPFLFCTSILLIATFMYKQWRKWAVWKIESGNVTVFEHLHIPYSNIRIFGLFQKWLISVSTWMSNFTFTSCDRSLPTDSKHSLFCVIFWLLSQKFSDRIFDRWTSFQTGGCMAADRKRGNCMALRICSLKENAS